MTHASTAPAARTLSPGLLMLLVSASCYGLNTPFARKAAQLGAPGTDIVALRVLALIVGVALFAKLAGQSLAVARRDRPALFLLGLTSAGVGVCYLSAVAFVPVGVAALIFYTYPLLILIASPLVDGSRVTKIGLIAFALAFGGIAIAIGPDFSSFDWRGILLAFGASVSAAVQFFVASRAPGGGGAATILWVQVVVLPIAIAVSLIVSGGQVAGVAAGLIGAASPVFWTIALFMVAFVLHMRGMRGASPSASGLIYCLEPVVATLFAAYYLGERLHLAQYVGAAMVLSAIVLNTIGNPPQKKRASLEATHDEN